MPLVPQTLAPRALELPTAGRALWLRADAGLYQDAAGTLPAAADNDPVAHWADAAGGPLAAVQPGSSLKRPRLRLAQVAGRPALRFDGVDDGLQVAGLTLSTFTLLAVARPTYPGPGDFNSRVLLEHSATFNDHPGHNLIVSRDATLLHGVRRGALASGLTSPPPTPLGETWCLLVHDYPDGTHAAHRLYRSRLAVPVSAETFAGMTADPGATPVTDTLHLAARNNTALFAQLDLAELVVYTPGLSAAARVWASRALAARYGVALT